MLRKIAVFTAAFTLLLAFGTLSVAAGGGCHTPAGTSEATGQLVSIKNCSFGPTILHTPVGGTVTWVNDDFLPHAVNGLGWDAIDPYTYAVPGTRLAHTFSAAGIYPYMCYVHPGMAGIVVVGDVAFPGAAPAPTVPLTQAAPVPAAAPLPAAAPIAASAVSSGVSAPVELPVALALVLGVALGAIATARWPRRRRVALPTWSA